MRRIRCRELANGDTHYAIQMTRFAKTRAFPWLIESDGFANQSRSDSSYLPMEVGRYVESPFH